MNYALDAIWWRLKNPVVRDLAVLLTAPVPWHSSAELPVAILLGNHGFRQLLDLDDHPQPLLDFLHNHPFKQHRLGLYAEQLLSFWFQTAAHIQFIQNNLAITHNKQTIGSIDFLIKINHIPYHIELTCKYFGTAHADVSAFVGLNPQDKLINKVVKLEQQLALSNHPAVISHLQQLGIDIHQLQRASIVRGMLFLKENQPALQAPINRLSWQGYLLDDWAQIPATLNIHPDSRFWLHHRLSLLAPAKIDERDSLSLQQAKSINQGILAVLERREDGYWHEIQRIMKIDNHKN